MITFAYILITLINKIDYRINLEYINI